jgi:uncharacterized protein (TIGR03435 family)
MKRREIDKVGESLRERKLSNDEVQSSVEHVWASLSHEDLTSAQPEAPTPRMPFFRWMPAAAAVLLVAGLAVAFWPRTPQATVQGGQLERGYENASQAIPVGQQFRFGEVIRSKDKDGTFTLADGSRVEVRAQSEVSLEFAEDGVRIRLNRGSVIVTAAKQHNGHLYVQTKDVTVSVVGTVFLVNAEAEGSRVAVIEGEVHVKEGDALKTLRPGAQVLTGIKMEALPLAQEVSWSPNAALHVALLQQNTVPPAEPRLKFAAASIKSLPPGGMYPFEYMPLGFGCRGIDGIKRSPFLNGGLVVVPQGRCFGKGVLLQDMVAMAYGIPRRYVLGGPPWSLPGNAGVTTGFEIDAVADDPSLVTSDQLSRMLRTTLAERFALKFHREPQELPGFGLTIGKSGLKMKDATGPEESPYPDFEQRATVMKGKSTLDELARWLTTQLATPIVNKTGVTGVYEYEFTIPPFGGGQRGEGQAPGVPPTPADRIPSYKEALEAQFGLRLESMKVSFETLVIDSVEMPTPN